ILTAPCDGLVVYKVPEQARWGIGTGSSVVVVGESVREGQVLMTIPDLTRFQVVTKVHEAQVSRIRPVQGRFGTGTAKQAKVMVDPFPDKVLRGHVQSVAFKAETPSFLSEDVKVYPTTIVLAEDPKMPALKPGMSAAVSILVEARKDVLRIPVQAVVGLRGKRVCYVKRDESFVQRELLLGVSNDTYVEVKEGLKEGEQVVLNPHALRSPRQVRLGWPRGTSFLVRSVRPEDATAPVSRVERYGVTMADLARFEEPIQGLAAVVPSRSFILTIRRPTTVRSAAVRLVATTPSYAVAYGIDR